MHRMFKKRAHVLACSLAATLAACLCFLQRPHWAEALENNVLDSLLTIGAPPAPTGQTVIVAIDDVTLAEFGPWPWPRDRTARLLDLVREAEPAAVGLDVVFPGSDPTVPASSGQPTDNDRLLADVLASGPFILGTYFSFAESPLGDATRSGRPVPAAFKTRVDAPSAGPGLWNARGAECSLDILAENAPGAGFFNLGADRDGVLRQVPLLMGLGGKDLYPGLALATWLYAKDVQEIIVEMSSQGVERIGIGSSKVPVGDRARMLLHWRGPAGTMPAISARDVLHGWLQPERLRGKVVLVGLALAGETTFATPFGPGVSSVEAHATVADNLVAGDGLYRPRGAFGAEFCALLVAGLLAAVLCLLFPTVLATILVVATGFLAYVVAWYELHNSGALFSPLYPMTVLFLVAILHSALNVVQTRFRNTP